MSCRLSGRKTFWDLEGSSVDCQCAHEDVVPWKGQEERVRVVSLPVGTPSKSHAIC